MAEFSKELGEMLNDFVVSELGSKVMDGVTYSMAFKPKDIELYNLYSNIKKETQQCGYRDLDVFRIYELSNGYIFDMDLSIAKRIMMNMLTHISNLNGGQMQVDLDTVATMPDQRRKQDMVSLAKYLKHEFDLGKNVVEVALFSRNSTNVIRINGRGRNDEMLSVRYNAYAVRHWDIEVLNLKLLMPAGFRVSRIKPCEILPSKTGVSFVLTMEKMDIGV